jgi:phosphoribosylaminoimidazole carboxylase PurE protein
MQRRIPQIGIVMNSDKDLPQMQLAAEFLHRLGIPFEMTVLSPYRTPELVREYGTTAARKGYEVVIAGAGGTNELACMIASYTPLPVIGVPLRAAGDSSFSKELAALLSTLETPPGIPVATVGFNDVENAACLAAQILGVKDRRIRKILEDFRGRLRTEARAKAEKVEEFAVQMMSGEPAVEGETERGSDGEMERSRNGERESGREGETERWGGPAGGEGWRRGGAAPGGGNER